MTVAAIASTHTKKLVKLGVSLFRRGFNASKCKTAAKMAVARIKLLRNKREVVVKQMKRDIALLLQSGQDSTARIRVEHVIREQNVLAANEFVELFCELIVTRLSIIAKRRECPADLKEGIASLIFAAPRCSEIPELGAIRDVFEKKYGKDFVSAATDLRPNCGVNRMLIDKLSVRTPTGEFKLKIMKEIAKEYQVEWDTTESEKELLKPPEELIEGPREFVSATSLPVNPIAPNQAVATNNNNAVASSPFPGTANSSDGSNHMYFEDSAAAAKAAAKCANEAIVAAKAAAYLANKDSNRASSQPPPSFGNNNLSNNNPSINFGYEKTLNPIDSQYMDDHDQYKEASGRAVESRSFNRSHHPGNEETMVNNNNNNDNGRMNRRHSYNAPSAHSDIKFDESDIDEQDEEIEADTPPNGTGFRQPQRAPPPVPMKKGSPYSVHPKLPDYDSLAARFEALKYHRKSQP